MQTLPPGQRSLLHSSVMLHSVLFQNVKKGVSTFHVSPFKDAQPPMLLRAMAGALKLRVPQVPGAAVQPGSAWGRCFGHSGIGQGTRSGSVTLQRVRDHSIRPLLTPQEEGDAMLALQMGHRAWNPAPVFHACWRVEAPASQPSADSLHSRQGKQTFHRPGGCPPVYPRQHSAVN